MKLLMISGSYPPSKCGVGTYVKNLTDALDQYTDIEVHVLTRHGAIKAGGSNVCVHRRINKWGMSSLYHVYRLVKELKPDIVHVQYPAADYEKYLAPYFIPALVRLMNSEIIQTWHEYFHLRSAIRNLPNALAATRILHLRERFYETLPLFYRYIVKREQFIKVSQGCNIPQCRMPDAGLRALRRTVTKDEKQIVTHFGYIGKHKNVHKLFELLDPDRHFIQLLCELDAERRYDRKILQYVMSDKWRSSVKVYGHLSAEDVANFISVSDAVVFLLESGVQLANTSYLAALNQGVFVVATSAEQAGYIEAYNTWFLGLDEVGRLAEILNNARSRKDASLTMRSWAEIALEHAGVYKANV